MNTEPLLPGSPWRLSHRADPEAVPLADRHYNRQKIGAPQIAPPGRALVLLAGPVGDPWALWITSWPYAQYVKHAWAGAWMCSAFRNENPSVLSSRLIRHAVLITRWLYGSPPEQGFVTFVDVKKTRPKAHPGMCYRKAGWAPVGHTAGGLLALRLPPDDPQMEDPECIGLSPVRGFSKGVVLL